MNQLETIPILSIAELRRILSDNDVQDIEISKYEQEKSMKDLLRQKWKEVKEVRKIN